MKNLLIFLALCTLAAAMVPRERRSEDIKRLCDPWTPCRWGVLKQNSKIVETFIENAYCDCSADSMCEESELDDNSYIYRCRSTKTENSDTN